MKQISGKILDKKYFIFDIDGTLVDSMQIWDMIDKMAVYLATGVLVKEELIKSIRDSVLYNECNLGGNIYDLFYQQIISYFNINMTVDEYKKFRHKYADHLSKDIVDFKAGASEFIQILKILEKKVAIATTTTKSQLEIYSSHNENMKRKFSINKQADVIVTCEDVEYKKPHPEAYLKAIEKLGAKPEECIVFEDSINGVFAAKNAGLEVVAVYDKSASDEQDKILNLADYQVESFDELIKALRLENLMEQLQY